MFSALFSRSRRPGSQTLTDLPSDFLHRVFLHLESARDVVSLQSTSKRLLEIGRSRSVWADRLRKEYGLRLEVETPSRV